VKLIAGLLVLVTIQTDPQALPRMVAAERAFAAATAEIGVRDGFLAFFADDSISIIPGADGTKVTVVPARAGLEARPEPKLPLAAQLIWEPFTGQVSSDGTLGWLTGGYASLTTNTREIAAQGAYFSVWKRQPNGTWRVWLDEGISLPDVWRDASPFRAAPDPDTAAAATSSSTETIDQAEQSVRAGGDAWRARLAEALRLHRDGRMPFVGREAAIAGMTAEWTTVRYTLTKTEAAASGDLGVTLGGYDATTASGPEHGTWVRVWKRDVTGGWRIVFETNKKTP
jgi:ketosteroid isomerase-like protein